MDSSKISIEERFQRLIELIKTSITVVSESVLISNEEKKLFLDDYNANLEEANYYFEIKKQNALKQLENIVLTPWNETMDEDSTRFWKLVKEKGIALEQEDKIGKILKKGVIKNFGEFELVQDVLVLYQQEGKISADEVIKLNQMLGDFEKKRMK